MIKRKTRFDKCLSLPRFAIVAESTLLIPSKWDIVRHYRNRSSLEYPSCGYYSRWQDKIGLSLRNRLERRSAKLDNTVVSRSTRCSPFFLPSRSAPSRVLTATIRSYRTTVFRIIRYYPGLIGAAEVFARRAHFTPRSGAFRSSLARLRISSTLRGPARFRRRDISILSFQRGLESCARLHRDILEAAL